MHHLSTVFQVRSRWQHVDVRNFKWRYNEIYQGLSMKQNYNLHTPEICTISCTPSAEGPLLENNAKLRVTRSTKQSDYIFIDVLFWRNIRFLLSIMFNIYQRHFRLVNSCSTKHVYDNKSIYVFVYVTLTYYMDYIWYWTLIIFSRTHAIIRPFIGVSDSV